MSLAHLPDQLGDCADSRCALQIGMLDQPDLVRADRRADELELGCVRREKAGKDRKPVSGHYRCAHGKDVIAANRHVQAACGLLEPS